MDRRNAKLNGRKRRNGSGEEKTIPTVTICFYHSTVKLSTIVCLSNGICVVINSFSVLSYRPNYYLIESGLFEADQLNNDRVLP